MNLIPLPFEESISLDGKDGETTPWGSLTANREKEQTIRF
jgi:hypothetical protein